jgi:hypothetical protein
VVTQFVNRDPESVVEIDRAVNATIEPLNQRTPGATERPFGIWRH